MINKRQKKNSSGNEKKNSILGRDTRVYNEVITRMIMKVNDAYTLTRQCLVCVKVPQLHKERMWSMTFTLCVELSHHYCCTTCLAHCVPGWK